MEKLYLSIFKKQNKNECKKKQINKKKKNFVSKFLIITIFLILYILIVNQLFIHSDEFSDISLVSFNLKRLASKENNKKKPKIVAITYSNQIYKRQMKLNRKSALEIGEVDEHYSYRPNNIDDEFKEKNKEIIGYGNPISLIKQ